MQPLELITYALTIAVGGLALFAAISSLRDPGLYSSDHPSAAAQARGQDAVIAVVEVPLLAVLLVLSWLDGGVATLLLAGMLGYLTYVYASYSFGLTFGRLFFVFVSALACAGFAMILAVHVALEAGLEVPTDPGPALWLAAGVLLFGVIAIAAMWMQQLMSAMRGGDATVLDESGGKPAIQVLDLAILLPVVGATAIAAVVGGGVAIAGVVVVLTIALAMSLAVVGMGVQQARAGYPDVPGTLLFVVMGAVQLVALAWLLSTF